MSRFRRSNRLAALAALTVVSVSSVGYASTDHNEARHLQESGEVMSLEAILERARAERPGRLLEAELEREKGRYVYEVEILGSDGVVWELKFDASSGELLRQERED